MATISYNESVNTEREKANLLCLIKLTLNMLIDQSSSAVATPILDDRSGDVTNFIITLEHILCFRMRGSWLSDRRYFWDFIRPACIGSCRQSIIERVEEVSKSRNAKEKGRAWIKIALMEKKLSELLKLVISDFNLVRKFYQDDSIMASSQAFILCDQLAGLSALDFSFCFKQDSIILAPLLLNDAEIDVIDLTPFLCYKSKQLKPVLTSQNIDEENQELTEREMVSFEKHKLEIEQRKYFEELLRHRDRELQQLKIRYETFKGEHESEVLQMENIILELQMELRTAREEVELKRKKIPSGGSVTPPKSLLNNQIVGSPTTPTNDAPEMNFPREHSDDLNTDKKSNEFLSPSSRRSSRSTTTTNTDDDQFELVRQLPSNFNSQTNSTPFESKTTSSPEMISSAASLSSATSLSDENEYQDQELTIIHTADENKSTN